MLGAIELKMQQGAKERVREVMSFQNVREKNR